MRVTNSMMLSSTLGDLNRTLSRLQRNQTELATGKSLQRASDDPARASSSMSMRNQLRRMEQYDRAMTDADGWLSTADSAIVTGLDLMNRVKQLVTNASNTATSNPSSRAALATEISQLRSEFLSLANTQYLGRSIFNGTADGQAYDATGTYQGNDAVVTRDISPNATMRANLTGPEIFGDPTSAEGDLFAMLSRLETAIVAGDATAIATEHTNLDAARSGMAAAAAEIGVRGSRLETLRARHESDEIMVREALSQAEDVDIAEALISVKASENSYTAALQAAGRILPPSLVDYLR